MGFILPKLPPEIDLETKAVLKKTASAHRYLAELKGISSTIPNQGILINTLPLQEAKDSSAIENIITTQDALYKEGLFPESTNNVAAKEVRNYVAALHHGYEIIRETGLITANNVQDIQAILELNNAGFRKLSGTVLINEATGETIYTPPQNPSDVIELMTNLERFINDDSFYEADPLVKMAVVHYQFESIHPFYDGNGRTGRIINVLYLIQQELLNIPVLYLSRAIIQTKSDYYNLLQKVREEEAWEEWILYMLGALEETSKHTIGIIEAIKDLLLEYKHYIRSEFDFYSQDLINSLFFHPYTKIGFIMNDLSVSRPTATKYLDELTGAGLLKKEKIGRSYYYINKALFRILTEYAPDYDVVNK